MHLHVYVKRPEAFIGIGRCIKRLIIIIIILVPGCLFMTWYCDRIPDFVFVNLFCFSKIKFDSLTYPYPYANTCYVSRQTFLKLSV